MANIIELTKEEYNSILECRDILFEKINMEDGSGGRLHPVFIVLLYSDSNFDHVAEKFVKNQEYWHAAIGFGPALSRTYSFNFDECEANKFKGGLSYESLEFYREEHPTGTMQVSCILLSSYKYKKLKKTLEYYIENKEKTKYDFIGLLFSLFKISTKNGLKFNLVCSTFVDTILRSINVKLSDQEAANLTKPDDLRANKEKEKQFEIFKGKIIDYDPKKAAKKVEEKYDDMKNSYFRK